MESLEFVSRFILICLYSLWSNYKRRQSNNYHSIIPIIYWANVRCLIKPRHALSELLYWRSLHQEGEVQKAWIQRSAMWGLRMVPICWIPKLKSYCNTEPVLHWSSRYQQRKVSAKSLLWYKLLKNLVPVKHYKRPSGS